MPEGEGTPKLVIPGQERDIPADVIPAGHNEKTTTTGLVVVEGTPSNAQLNQEKPEGQTSKELQAFTPQDMPQEAIVNETKDEPIVPLHVWLTSPLGGLQRLAQETNNDTTLTLIQMDDNRRKLLDETIGALTKGKPLTEAESKDESTRERAVQKNMLQQLHEADSEDVKNLEKTKRTMQNEMIQKLQEKDYSKEERKKMQKDLDTFLMEVIHDTKDIFTSGQQEPLLNQLTHLTDLLRYQTKSMVVRGEQTMEALVEIATDPRAISPKLLDFLTRFDIPPSLAGELLPKLDQGGHLAHPLAWYLLDKLPEKHPFKQEQNKRVQRLTVLMTDDISEEDMEEAVELRDKIVSVYVDPDLEETKDKVGLEYESLPLLDAVSLPEGMTMGQDYLIDSIPEIRLDTDDAILMYGKAWRERYYQMHLWSETAQAEKRTLHVHVNKNEATSIMVYRILFGLTNFEVEDNPLGTTETKITLTDYKTAAVQEKGVRGFSSEYMPELVELLYSLREAQITPIDLTNLPTDRFTFFTKAIENPTSRAAMLVAMRGEAGLRTMDPKRFATHYENPPSALNEEEDMFVTLAENIGGLDPRSQERIITTIIDESNFPAMITLAQKIEEIDPRARELVITAAIGTAQSETLMELAKNIALFDPLTQDRILTASIETYSLEAILELGKHIGKLTPQMQDYYLEWVIAEQDNYAIQALSAHVDALNQSAQTRYLDWVIQTKNPAAIRAVREKRGQAAQEQIITQTLEDGNYGGLWFLAGDLDVIDPLTQEKIVLTAFQKNDENTIKVIGKNIKTLQPEVLDLYLFKALVKNNYDALVALGNDILAFNPEDQTQIIEAILETESNNTISILTENIESLIPTLQDQIVTAILDADGMEYEFLHLAKKIEAFNPQSQERIIVAAIETDNENVIQKLAQQADAITSTALRSQLLAMVEQQYPLLHKALLCNKKGWDYALAG